MTWVFLLVTSSAASTEAPSLQSARKLWLHGNYEEAREQYESLAKNPDLRAPAAIGISLTWQSVGEYDKALAAVDAALANMPRNDRLLARRAELLYLRGRSQEAHRAADSALEVKPDNFLARWIRARVLADRGDLEAADRELRWFVRTYTKRNQKDNDIKDPEELLLIGLAGSENARWHHLSDQYRFILTDVYGDAERTDKDFWPAEFQAGLLLQEKYNRSEAANAFEKALAINPHAAEIYVAKGRAALDQFEVSDAEKFAAHALRINPGLASALCLRFDIRFLAGDLPAARRDLDAALRINPHDESTLGRLAACLFLQHEKRSLQDLVKEVERRDSRPSAFYQELAERLDARRHFEETESFYKKAIEFRPMLAGARTGLGLLYMRLAREAEAKDVLSKAFEADDFNLLVSNTLKVLRHLEKYDKLTMPHFEVRFNPETDRRLARYMLPYLEAIYEELSKNFEYRPSRPILIEIFSSHEKFSGRITSLPDLHTVAACTGRVMAMASPNAEGIGKPFNWMRVLRHELVHMFNLDQTHFLVPHWLTEGLAVNFEGFPRPPQWSKLLLERVPARELMTLEAVEQSFIRPASPLDWHMAYCQSQLYVQFLREHYGSKATTQMLTAFRDGRDTQAAIKHVCHESKEAFESNYRSYVRGIVGKLHPQPLSKPQSFLELQKDHESSPDDAGVSAALAEQYLIRHDPKEARRLAEEVLARHPVQPVAAYVKARLLIEAGEDDPARRLLEQALNRKSPEPRVLQLLGKLYYEAQAFQKAARTYELGSTAEPYEDHWLYDLARVYGASGDAEKLITVLERLVKCEGDDIRERKRLAKLLLGARRYSDAEHYAREALEIDIRDSEACDMVEQALMAQRKPEAAAILRKTLRDEATH
jgi:tetratricopeptide (TPR) repeat protein